MSNIQPIAPDAATAAEELLATVAGLVYDELPGLLAGDLTASVRDVWMVVDGDSTTLQVAAEGVTTSQRLEPGTFLIIHLDSPVIDALPTKGLYAFPVEG